MRTTTLRVLSLAVLAAANLSAQDITGDWQGTLHRDTSNFRSINRISHADDGAWMISLLLLDQRGFSNPVTASAVSFHDSVLKATFDDVSGVYDAKLSADGNTLHGTWTQRGSTLSRSTTGASPRRRSGRIHRLTSFVSSRSTSM